MHQDGQTASRLYGAAIAISRDMDPTRCPGIATTEAQAKNARHGGRRVFPGQVGRAAPRPRCIYSGATAGRVYLGAPEGQPPSETPRTDVDHAVNTPPWRCAKSTTLRTQSEASGGLDGTVHANIHSDTPCKRRHSTQTSSAQARRAGRFISSLAPEPQKTKAREALATML